MKIAFYAGNCIPIHANTLDERPLGGTETGLIRLAEVLERRGHQVLVFTKMEKPPHSSPKYHFHGKLLEFGPYDLLVHVKDWRSIYYGAKAARNFFWSGDGWDQYANFGMGDMRVVKRIDRFLAASNWHASTLCEKSGFPPEKAFSIGNGVFLPYFENREERLPKRLIYASAPYRGLELMPKIFSELKKKHSELEFHVFAGMDVYNTDRQYAGAEVAIAQKIGKVLKSIEGVHVYGNIPQKDLAREMMKSSILVYPNTVFETCCMVAMEAQAAGCAVVASANSGLIETVGENGFLIKGIPGSSEYLEQFISKVDLLLKDPSLLSKISSNSLKRAAAEFGWEKVADRFESLL